MSTLNYFFIFSLIVNSHYLGYRGRKPRSNNGTNKQITVVPKIQFQGKMEVSYEDAQSHCKSYVIYLTSQVP